jgi:tRNA 2-selenouridine synthase
MPVAPVTAEQALRELDRFSAVIDARSPSEYAMDHLPGAVNWPTLDDAQRALVGTEYKQVSAFQARKRGAAMAARNIAAHIDRELQDAPKEWQPLVYCWRGGKRSGSLALVLGEIGFRVSVLEGGYRAFRRAVIEAIELLPAALELRVVCGTTGSGKSRLLQRLAQRGAQVLDLEQLANHRGSVLGLVPGSPQPGQKMFETRLWDTLRRFDPARPVIVESESRKIGDLRVPEALLLRMRAAPCVVLELPLDARVALLMDEYRFFVDDIATFCARLDALRVLRGHEVVDRWQAASRAGAVADVVRELLLTHYDPVYLQSIRRNFAGYAAPRAGLEWKGDEASLDAAADAVLGLA